MVPCFHLCVNLVNFEVDSTLQGKWREQQVIGLGLAFGCIIFGDRVNKILYFALSCASSLLEDKFMITRPLIGYRKLRQVCIPNPTRPLDLLDMGRKRYVFIV